MIIPLGGKMNGIGWVLACAWANDPKIEDCLSLRTGAVPSGSGQWLWLLATKLFGEAKESVCEILDSPICLLQPHTFSII
jgi:hypothetical protein